MKTHQEVKIKNPTSCKKAQFPQESTGHQGWGRRGEGARSRLAACPLQGSQQRTEVVLPCITETDTGKFCLVFTFWHSLKPLRTYKLIQTIEDAEKNFKKKKNEWCHTVRDLRSFYLRYQGATWTLWINTYKREKTGCQQILYTSGERRESTWPLKEREAIQSSAFRGSRHTRFRGAGVFTLLRSNLVKFCSLRHTEGQSRETNGLLWA